MNKERFLKELEKKLKVLSQEEKQDILNEYEDIITEKVKHGKTEEEAVKEFGDLNSLSEEILKSYKIDPKYQKSGNDLLNDCEDLIKKGAQKLTEVTEEVVDSIKKADNKTELETIFEVIIKVILILLGIAFLHIPFWIVGEVGKSVIGGLTFNSMFFFENNIVAILWKVLVEITYVIVCALLIVMILRKSVTSSSVEDSKKKSNPVRKIKENQPVNSEESIKVNTVRVSENNTHVLSDILLILLKCFICMVFIFPMILLAIGIGIVLCVLIYLLIKGIGIYAPFFLVLGIFTLTIYIIHIFTHILFAKKRIYVWPLIGSFFMIILGGIFTIDYAWSFTYHKDFSSSVYHKHEEKFDIEIEDYLSVPYDEIQIDNSLEDNKVRIEVEYYDEFISLDKEESIYKESYHHGNHYQEEKEEYTTKRIYFYTEHVNKHSINEFINKTIVPNLKNHELYDYSNLFNPYIKVFVNENTKDRVF